MVINSIPKDEMVAVALEVDSKLTDAPVFVEHPTKDNLQGKVISELDAQGKIEQSDDGKIWSDYDGSLKEGKHYRAVATNKNGSTISNSFNIPTPKK